METFTVTIDGIECKAKAGQTILEVAQENGIHIPVFCHHKELRPEGACRVCLVEVEGAPRLATACTLNASPGMVVRTNTEKVKKARSMVIELLLNNHTLECPICDRAGECELQDIAYTYGPTDSRFKEERREKNKIIKDPLIEINNDRCILCRRCIRMCGENMGNRVLGVMERGATTYISPFGEDFTASGCMHCGSCIDVCPVGCLLDRSFKYRDRTWRMNKTWTICGHCGSGCRVEIDSYKGVVKRATGRIGINDGPNKGYLCVRGRWGWDHIYSDKRLRKPLLKDGNGHREISYSEAINILKEKINTTDASSINIILGSTLTNEELQLIKSIFSAENITSNSYTYHKALEGVASITGELKTDNFSSVEKSNTIVILADFIESTNPVIATLLRLSCIKNGKKLIKIGTVKTNLNNVSAISITKKDSEILDVIKHAIMHSFDQSYTSGDEGIDSFIKSIQHSKVTFIIGGATLYSPDIGGISRAVALLSTRLPTPANIVIIPPGINSYEIARTLPHKSINELTGRINILFETSITKDFPGANMPPADFTIVLSAFYTPDIPKAELVIPVTTPMEKSGTISTIHGTNALVKSAEGNGIKSTADILKELGGSIDTSKVPPPDIQRNSTLPQSSIPSEGLLLTAVPSKTGHNDLSYYSENVGKVSEETCLLVNPSIVHEKQLVSLKTESSRIDITAIPDYKIPKTKVVLKIERMTPEISKLFEKYHPYMCGIPCTVEV